MLVTVRLWRLTEVVLHAMVPSSVRKFAFLVELCDGSQLRQGGLRPSDSRFRREEQRASDNGGEIRSEKKIWGCASSTLTHRT